MTWLDFIGYSGSVLVAISLMMANMKRLRWINLFGATVFSGYGFLIGAYPVFVLNAWIVLTNIYYLTRLYQFKDDFDLVKLSSVRTALFGLLMQRYGEDIQQLFPEATMAKLEKAVALLVFRNMKPVGIFAYQKSDVPGTVDVLIDYVIPEARDFKTARYLFDQHAIKLREDSISILISKSKNSDHIVYLTKMGFIEKEGVYQLELSER